MHIEPIFLDIVKLVVHIVPLPPVAPDMNALGALLTHGDMKVPPRLRRMVPVNRIGPKGHAQRHPAALRSSCDPSCQSPRARLEHIILREAGNPLEFDKARAPLYTTSPNFCLRDGYLPAETLHALARAISFASFS